MIDVLALAAYVCLQSQPPFEERDLGTVPGDFSPGWTYFTATGMVGAATGRKGNDRFVAVGNHVFGPYQETREVVLSPDGSDVAFEANRGGKLDFKTGRMVGGKWFVVRGEKEGQAYDGVGSLKFTPDGKDVVYIARDKGKSFVVVGDKSWPSYDYVRWVEFASDGTVAFACNGGTPDAKGVVRGGQWFLIKGNTQNPTREGTKSIVFSPSKKGLAILDDLSQRDKGLETLLVDGVKVEEYERLWNLKYSPDGKTVACAAGDQAVEFISVGGKREKTWSKVEDFVFHPDGKQVAYVAQNSLDGWFAVFGAKQGEQFSHVFNLTWSPDGKTLAYCGRKFGMESESYLIVGEQKSPRYSEIGAPHFSADGRKVAFGARAGRLLSWKVLNVGPGGLTPPEQPGRLFLAKVPPEAHPRNLVFGSKGSGVWYISDSGMFGNTEASVIAGEKVLETVRGRVWGPVVTGDGKSLAYAIKEGKQSVIVAKGRRSDPLDDVDGIAMSSDGLHLAYSARKGPKWFCVLDGRFGDPFDWVTQVVLSKDGSTAAYVGATGKVETVGGFGPLDVKGEWTVVLNGKKFEAFDRITSLTLSADGTTTAYAARKGKKWVVGVNDSWGEEFDGIAGLALSSNGKTVAYGAAADGKSFLVIGHQKTPVAERIGQVALSADGKVAAYVAMVGPERVIVGSSEGVVVVGDKRGEKHEGIRNLVISSDGKTAAYLAGKGREKTYVVAGTRVSKEYEIVGPPEFSADGKKVGFGCLDEGFFWWQTVDIP